MPPELIENRTGPPQQDEATRPRRVCNLVSLDAANIMRRLAAREARMIELFSKLRDRGVLLRTLRSHFETVRFEDLVCLEPRQQQAISDFYEAVEELRNYFLYTQDMPQTAAETLTGHMDTIAAAYVVLRTTLDDHADPT